ncbi:nucleoside triphosphate pyrophosphohydrolase [Mycolicibacter hiberniae]|uniref:Nucleoside triphosphate pyrophosphohydrolase n=1 Tax=Mycolicibacter hiberniae TaxID=29314 RepID=A0A7I7WY74_9MYCO|nr:nucleoside triphosphate pyrophosphohydrolase [Mycolicibacter hiberniae]MCV7086525.1 nucleoside triphosphate pyrophosphohydrolase [Mycolicibacter hiberniae]ORV69968.1 nucleoside triphosphate hydrolase [Mycolicibacter hiberniae]BBZ22100.1 nucleoside triphosphate pyrophosphohydrolase [Mycolicibacter hiberniae]
MTVVLVDPRRPTLVPVEALALLSGEVAYTAELPIAVPWSLPAAHSVLSAADDPQAPVLLSSDRDHPAVLARLAAGEALIAAPDPAPGERLIDAVAVMDRLRTSGPWEGEQTHDSLRRFLLEETYELFDAVRSGDAQELCAELGDVLLQVLFHARIAEDAPEHPFSIDDVADSLLRKLRNRAPAVLAGEEISLAEQMAQWEERKALEKLENTANAPGGASILGNVPTAQPALALAGKVLQRLARAGVPADLIPEAVTTVTVAAGVDAENDLRTAVLELMDAVRVAERAIIGEPTEQQWRAHWPAEPPVEPEPRYEGK